MEQNNLLTSFKTLSVTIKNKILVVEFNRTKSLNSMNEEVFQNLFDLFSNMTKLTKDEDIRVIIIRGQGKHFTSGLDLKSDFAMSLASLNDPESTLDVGRKAFYIYNSVHKLQDCLTAIEKCHIPVIASVHGYCLGAGINLIPCCDIAICAKNALFSVKETTIGMVSDIGALQRITKNNGNVGLLKKLSLTGEMFGWETALKLGVVVDVAEDEVDLEKKVFALAEQIAEKSPMVNWGIKRIINFSRDNPINESLDMVATMNSAFLQAREVEDSVKAVLTKTKAIYPKL